MFNVSIENTLNITQLDLLSSTSMLKNKYS